MLFAADASAAATALVWFALCVRFLLTDALFWHLWPCTKTIYLIKLGLSASLGTSLLNLDFRTYPRKEEKGKRIIKWRLLKYLGSYPIMLVAGLVGNVIEQILLRLGWAVLSHRFYKDLKLNKQ